MKTAAENHHRLEAEEGEEEAAAVVEEDIINEIVIDEFSLLLFRSLDDYNVLKDREDAIKAEEETAEKQRQHEENLRMNRVKKKGRRSQAELKREKKEAKKRVRQERKEQRKKEREERRQQRKLALQTSQNSGGADAGGVGGPMAQLAEDMAERKRQRREQRKEAKVAEREKRREERRRQRQTKRGEDKRAKRISNKSSTVPCAPNVQPSDISSSTSSSSNSVENVVSGLLRLRDGGLKSAEHDGSPVNFKPQQLPSSSSSTAEMVTASIAASTTTGAAAAAATKRPSSATIGIAATRRNGLMRAETTAGLLQCMPPASKMAKLEEVKLEEFGRTTPSSNRSLLIGIAASNSSGAMQLQQTVPTDASFAQQTKTLQQHQNVFKAALERDLLQKVSDAVPSLQQGGGGSSTTGHLPHADQQHDNPCSFRDSLAYNFHQSLATLYAIDPSLAAKALLASRPPRLVATVLLHSTSSISRWPPLYAIDPSLAAKAALGLPSAPFGGDSAAALNKANSVLQQSSQKFPAVSDLPQQQHQQQHQLVVNNGRVLGVDAAAALGLPSTSAVLPPPSSASASGASCGVSRPPPPPLDSHPANLAVVSQKVGRTSAAVAPTSASIQQTNAAVHIPFKNGRWCNMHATIAHEIAKHVEAQKKIANVRTTNNTGGSHRKQSTTTSATGCGGREHQQKTERKQSSVSVATSSSSSFPAQQSNEQQQQQNNKNGSRGANNAMANASAPTMAQHHQLLQLQQEQGKRTGNNLLPNSASASSFPMLSAASVNLNLQQQIALLMGQQQQQQQQQRISTFNDSSPLHSHGARFPVQGTNSLGPFASSSGPLNPLGGLSQFLSANSVHPAVGSMPPHLFGGFPIQPMGPGGGSLTSGNSDAAAAAQLHQHAQLLALLQQQSNNNPPQQHHPASLSAAFALQPNSNNNNINAANDSNNASAAAAATQCAMANNFLAQFGASSVASNSAANSNATNNINTMVAAGAGGHQQQPNNNMLSSLVGPANLAFAANILNPTALPSLQQQQQQNSLALSQMANTGSNNAATAAGGAHALMHSGTFNHNNNSSGNEATGAESILAAFLSGQSLVTSSASNALNSSNPAMGIEQFVRSQFGGRMDGPPMMALGNQMQLSKMTGSNLIPPPPSALLSAGHLSVNPASVINPIEQELLMMRHFGLVNQRSQQLLGASLSGAGMDSLPSQNGPPKQDTGVISTANGSTAAAAAHNRHDMSRT
uniref:INCENP_ARK-bind domain-containing protein n=1 Tax=Globodera pallida TaxID=36090 RepID=A0A183BLX8_GLOPA